MGIDRRRVVLSSALLLIAARLGRAQPAVTMARVGVLMPSTASATANLVAAFVDGLRELGYAPGQNLELTYRYSSAQPDQVGAIAREFVRAELPVILTTTDSVVATVARAAPQASIVMVNTSDPVGNGLVASLAHPGGRVTGLTNLSPEIGGKRVELLKECAPAISRLAYLWNSRLPGAIPAFEEVRQAAQRLRLELSALEVRRADEISRALGEVRDGARTALLVQAPNPMLYTQRALLCRMAKARGLPTMFNRVEYARAGGLLSYGPNVPEMYRRAAGYVDRILKGASPGDLPVEQPSKFELAVNLDTARAIGLVVPPLLVGRADTIIG